MRTILRFETPEGHGPMRQEGGAYSTRWFYAHYTKMASAGTSIPKFRCGVHFCAIDIAGAPYWLTPECLADAERDGMVLKVLIVRECVDEEPGYLWATSSTLQDEQGRTREYQVGFVREDIVSCRTIRPTEFRHVAYP